MDENVRHAVARLRALQHSQRPATVPKLQQFFKRRGSCTVQVPQLVHPGVLAAAMLPLIEDMPDVHKQCALLATLARLQWKTEESNLDLVGIAATRCVKRLRTLGSTWHAQLTLASFTEWICPQAFGTIEEKPEALVAKLFAHHLMVVAQPSGKISYEEDALAAMSQHAKKTSHWSSKALNVTVPLGLGGLYRLVAAQSLKFPHSDESALVKEASSWMNVATNNLKLPSLLLFSVQASLMGKLVGCIEWHEVEQLEAPQKDRKDIYAVRIRMRILGSVEITESFRQEFRTAARARMMEAFKHSTSVIQVSGLNFPPTMFSKSSSISNLESALQCDIAVDCKGGMFMALPYGGSRVAADDVCSTMQLLAGTKPAFTYQLKRQHSLADTIGRGGKAIQQMQNKLNVILVVASEERQLLGWPSVQMLSCRSLKDLQRQESAKVLRDLRADLRVIPDTLDATVDRLVSAAEQARQAAWEANHPVNQQKAPVLDRSFSAQYQAYKQQGDDRHEHKHKNQGSGRAPKTEKAARHVRERQRARMDRVENILSLRKKPNRDVD